MKRPSRATVVGSVYFEHGDGAPSTSVELRGSVLLQTDEQAYSRRFKATDELAPLDAGWLAGGCSIMVLEAEERAVLYAAGEPLCEVRRGKPCLMGSPQLKQLSVRGSGWCTVTLLPE